MKTKFILHGGFTPKSIQENDPFFKEILKSVPDDCKILLVYFAKELDRIASNKQEDVLQFEKNKGDKRLSFEVADENIFLEQIKKSDVIYLHGGSTVKLLDTLKKFSSLKKLFEGKIVAADSAGVNGISCYCYSNMADVILEGVGIIPFKTICHYSDKHKKIVEDFDKYDNSLKLLLLKEYQYQVFYQ